MEKSLNNVVHVVKVEDVGKVRCSNCKKLLMIVFHQKTASDMDSEGNKLPVLFKIVVDCPFCGDKSFQEPVYGVLRFLPAEHIIIKNALDEPNDIKHFLTGKTK